MALDRDMWCAVVKVGYVILSCTKSEKFIDTQTGRMKKFNVIQAQLLVIMTPQ